jgi:hypothetical protein
MKLNYIETKHRSQLDAATLAADYKARGIERGVSWSRFVQDMNLNPGMDAKAFLAIYDSVPAVLYRGEVRQAAGETHRITYPAGYSREVVITEQNEYFVAWVDTRGIYGSDTFASGITID